MSAAAKPAYDYRRRQPKSPKPLPASEGRIFEAAQQLIAEGQHPTDVNLLKIVKGMSLYAVRAAYSRLVRKGLVPSRSSIPRRNPNPPVAPCARCDTPGGYTPNGTTRPERHNLEPWKRLCRKCYSEVRQEQCKAESELLRFDEDGGAEIRRRCQVVRGDRKTASILHMENYDANRSRWQDGLAAVREVTAEQEERRRGIELRLTEERLTKAQRGAAKARREYWEAVGRLKGWDPMARAQV